MRFKVVRQREEIVRSIPDRCAMMSHFMRRTTEHDRPYDRLLRALEQHGKLSTHDAKDCISWLQDVLAIPSQEDWSQENLDHLVRLQSTDISMVSGKWTEAISKLRSDHLTEPPHHLTFVNADAMLIVLDYLELGPTLVENEFWQDLEKRFDLESPLKDQVPVELQPCVAMITRFDLRGMMRLSAAANLLEIPSLITICGLHMSRLIHTTRTEDLMRTIPSEPKFYKSVEPYVKKAVEETKQDEWMDVIYNNCVTTADSHASTRSPNSPKL